MIVLYIVISVTVLDQLQSKVGNFQLFLDFKGLYVMSDVKDLIKWTDTNGCVTGEKCSTNHE